MVNIEVTYEPVIKARMTRGLGTGDSLFLLLVLVKFNFIVSIFCTHVF